MVTLTGSTVSEMEDTTPLSLDRCGGIAETVPKPDRDLRNGGVINKDASFMFWRFNSEN